LEVAFFKNSILEGRRSFFPTDNGQCKSDEEIRQSIADHVRLSLLDLLAILATIPLCLTIWRLPTLQKKVLYFFEWAYFC
jgi:hypothetical protein